MMTMSNPFLSSGQTPARRLDNCYHMHFLFQGDFASRWLPTSDALLSDTSLQIQGNSSSFSRSPTIVKPVELRVDFDTANICGIFLGSIFHFWICCCWVSSTMLAQQLLGEPALFWTPPPCIVISAFEGQRESEGEVKKLAAVSVHQLINNQKNICSSLKMVGRRTGFCDKSILCFFFRDYVKRLLE